MTGGGAFLIGSATWATRDRPPIALVDSRLARGTSLLTRMQVEVAAASARAAGLDPGAIATVFGSWHGEMEIAVEQLGVIHRGDGLMSPARFRNSVHNTGSGVFTIAAKNRGFTTAIAAGPGTFAMCVIEALGLLAAGEPAVVVAVADEPLPAPLDALSGHDALGVAIALARTPRAGSPAMALRRVRFSADPDSPVVEVAARFGEQAAAPALALVEASARGAGGAGVVALGGGWLADLCPT